MSVVNRGPVTPRSSQNLGPGDSPTFVQLTLTGLDASKVVVTDASKKLSSGTNTNAELANAVSLAHSAVTLGMGSDVALALSGQQLTLTLPAGHARQHALDATADHTIGGLTNTYLVKSDGSKLVPATNTDADVADAVSKKHALGADTTLGAMTADVNMNSHKLTGLSVPASAGDSVRATAKITEALLESATDLKHAAVTVSAPIALSTQALSLVNNAGSPATVTALDIGTLANSDTLVPTSKAVTTALAAKLSITSLKFPFYIAAGTLDTIALTADQKLPFYLTDGGANNIPLTT